MTNINCVRDCIFQHDGKCCYDNITIDLSNCYKPENSDCVYQLFPKSPNTNDKEDNSTT